MSECVIDEVRKRLQIVTPEAIARAKEANVATAAKVGRLSLK